jgi:hypothetical protein
LLLLLKLFSISVLAFPSSSSSSAFLPCISLHTFYTFVSLFFLLSSFLSLVLLLLLIIIELI